MIPLGIIGGLKGTFQNVSAGTTISLYQGSLLGGTLSDLLLGNKVLTSGYITISPNAGTLTLKIDLGAVKNVSRINIFSGLAAGYATVGSSGTPNTDLMASSNSGFSNTIDGSVALTNGSDVAITTEYAVSSYLSTRLDFTEVANVRYIYVSLIIDNPYYAYFAGIEAWGIN